MCSIFLNLVVGALLQDIIESFPFFFQAWVLTKTFCSSRNVSCKSSKSGQRVIEFGQPYAPHAKLAFGPLATVSDHCDCESTLVIPRVVSSFPVLRGKVPKVGVARSMVVCCLVTTVWCWVFAKFPRYLSSS